MSSLCLNDAPLRCHCRIPALLTLRLLACAALLCALTGSARVAAPADRLAPRSDRFLRRTMRRSPVSGWSSVIVRLEGRLTPAREAQIQRLGADLYRRLPLVQSVAVRVPRRKLPALAGLPFVQRLSMDVTVRKTDEFTVSASGADMVYQQNGLTGTGVGIAVIDSGIRAHQDLSDPGLLGTGLLSSTRIVKSVNFVPGTTSAYDECGHGTHVAGILAGNGTASKGLDTFHTFYGIARKARLINVRVLDRNGRGEVSSVIAGIQWVVSNRSRYNIRVINLSLGHPVGESYTTDPLCQAVEQAWKAGIVVVCAAGNNGRQQDTTDPSLDNEGYGTAYGSIQSPGNDPYVITVGAMKRTDGSRAGDRIATYSSRGPSRLDFVLKPDLVAPGNRIISTQADESYLDDEHSSTNQVPWGYYRLSLLGGNSNKYFRLSGTSMAAPVVAGSAALLLQADPALSPDTIKARLMLSADKWAGADGTGDPCTYGAGYLNLPAALACPFVATEPALSPQLAQDAGGNVYLYACGDTEGTKAIWGKFNVNDLKAIWGKSIVDGSSILEASKAIWGKTIWFDKAIWGVGTGSADLSMTALQGEP